MMRRDDEGFDAAQLERSVQKPAAESLSVRKEKTSKSDDIWENKRSTIITF